MQGGGALGAYQAGVYEALAEVDLHRDWVAGISIGAINAALVAGNPPEARVDKLRAFWETVTADLWPGVGGHLKNGTLRTYKGFPHGMPTTQADTINADLPAFIRA